MAIVPINRIGGAVDTAELTAVPGDVLSPDIFIGSGSDENQQGSVIVRGSPTYSLPINGSQTLPPGHYSGGSITQNIPSMGPQSIAPGAQMIVLPTTGHYMTDNIVIKTTKNLIPSVIKKGVTVGGVTGTFEGYVITDPNTLYKYGTFNGIQSVTAFKYKLWDSPGTFTLERDNMKVYVSNSFHQTAVVFNTAVDLTNLNQLIVRLENSSAAIQSISLYRNLVTDYIWDNTNSSHLVKNTNLGEEVAGMNTSGTGGDYTLNVASKTGNAYLYLMFAVGSITSNVYLVKFE